MRKQSGLSIKAKRNITLLAIVGLTFLFAHGLVLVLPGAFEIWNAQINDLLFHLRYALNEKEKVSPYVIHIVFNDASYRELELVPWDRTVYGKLIRIAGQAGIKRLAYDVFFKDRSSEANDRLLVAATGETEIVYYPLVLYAQDYQKETGKKEPAEEEIIGRNIWYPEVLQEGKPPVAELAVMPFKELSAGARGLGHVNIDPDRDGINRRFPLLYRYKNGYLPSLIFRMLCDYLKVTDKQIKISFGKYIILENAHLPGDISKDIKIPIDDKGRVIINYVAPWQDSFFEFPVKDLLKAEQNREYQVTLRDKLEDAVAIISDISARNKDIGPGIFDKAYPYGGLHVNIANMILTGNFIAELDLMAAFLIGLVLISGLWLLAVRFKPLWFLLFSLLLYLSFLCFNALLFINFKTLPQTIAPSLGFSLALIFISVYRYFAEEQEKVAFRVASEANAQLAAKLQELDKLKTHFVQNITHEFRTPLNLILSPLEALLQQKDGLNHDKLYKIKENTQKLKRLVDNLLDLARVESGKTELHAEEQELIGFLQRMIDSFKHLALEKNIKLFLKSEQKEQLLHLDTEKFEKIISNLLTNALKYTGKGGEITVSISRPVQFTAELYNWMWERKPPEQIIPISIKDTGCGIKAKELPFIFDRFFSKSDTGTGIGLALVKEYMALHYGAVNVESEWGKGSTFSLLLPAGKEHLAPVEIRTAVSALTYRDDKDPPARINAITKNKADTTYPETPVLIVDDEAAMLEDYQAMLAADGITNLLLVSESREVMTLLENQPVSVIVLDISMPHITGDVLLKQIKQKYPAVPVIMATGTDTAAAAVQCMRDGAFDYLVKPVEVTRLVAGIKHCLEIIELEKEIQLLSKDITATGLEHPEHFSGIITRNEKMFALFKKLEAISKSANPILIRGESGTGKELIAKAIHLASGRPGEFVSVNVAGLDDSTFTDTLFGHVKGAFTGAVNARSGLVKTAENGTLFLDEIGDLEHASQVKLLRLIQENEYYTLGLDSRQYSKARIVAATNADLEEKIKQGQFRNDLLYRFTHTVNVIPLRDRLDDIPPLLKHLLEKSAKANDKKVPAAPRELEILLKTYHFPGNIRELEHMVEEAVSRHESKKLSLAYFREYIQKQSGQSKITTAYVQSTGNRISYTGAFPTLEELEKHFLKEALQKAKGNKTIAAQLLGITYFTLNRRLKKFKIEN